MNRNNKHYPLHPESINRWKRLIDAHEEEKGQAAIQSLFTKTMIKIIKDKRAIGDDVILLYRKLLRYVQTGKVEYAEKKKIDEAIINRWSKKSLNYIQIKSK